MGTPIEKYFIGNYPVWVKREDLAFPPPAPSFSKVRGVLPHIQKLKDRGWKYVGYTETTISMAGWGVAWACKKIGKIKSVIYEPVYKCDREDLIVLESHKKMWEKFGAIINQIPASRAKVNFYLAKNHLLKNYSQSIMLPLGLPLPETIKATAEVAYHVEKDNDFDCVIVNVGSGTICAGIVRGMCNTTVYGVMGRTGSIELKQSQILGKSGSFQGGFFGKKRLILIDPGYEYTEPAKGCAPFPCHKYYDLKAWNWLVENIEMFKDKKVLFWNIGS